MPGEDAPPAAELGISSFMWMASLECTVALTLDTEVCPFTVKTARPLMQSWPGRITGVIRPRSSGPCAAFSSSYILLSDGFRDTMWLWSSSREREMRLVSDVAKCKQSWDGCRGAECGLSVTATEAPSAAGGK